MSRYPEIRAGQRITGRMLTGIQFEEVVKQAATTRASNTTISPDPDLQFTLEPNATYHVEFFVQYTTSSVAMFKCSWSVPSGASGLRRRGGGADVKSGTSTPNNSDGPGNWTDMAWAVHDFDTVCKYGDRPSDPQTWLTESGIVTTSAGGVLSFDWAQNASDSFPAEVQAFSYARLKRVA